MALAYRTVHHNVERQFFKTEGVGEPCRVDADRGVSHVIDSDEARGYVQLLFGRTACRQRNAKSINISDEIITVPTQVLEADRVRSGEGYQVQRQCKRATFVVYSGHCRWWGCWTSRPTCEVGNYTSQTFLLCQDYSSPTHNVLFCSGREQLQHY